MSNTIEAVGEQRGNISEKSSSYFDNYQKYNKPSLLKEDKPNKQIYNKEDEKKVYIKTNEDFTNFLKNTVDYFKKDHGLKTKNQEKDQILNILKKEQENEILSNKVNELEEKYKLLKHKYNDLKNEKKAMSKHNGNQNQFENDTFIFLRESNDMLKRDNSLLRSKNKDYKKYIKDMER